MICLLESIETVGDNKSELITKTNGKYHLRVILKDVLGFAEHQGKTTYGLGYL